MTRGYDHYEEIFNTVNPVGRFFAGEKNCGTHVFRHSIMKTMFANGATKEDIRVHFGLTNIETVDKYLNRDIFAESVADSLSKRARQNVRANCQLRVSNKYSTFVALLTLK